MYVSRSASVAGRPDVGGAVVAAVVGTTDGPAVDDGPFEVGGDAALAQPASKSTAVNRSTPALARMVAVLLI
jgi:hypothetical protein